MKDYQKYINALRKCAKEHENDKTPLAHVIVSDLCRDTANFLEELEQEEKTGHWIFKHFDEETGISDNYWCSECGKPLAQVYKSYCSNCGSKIVESEE